MNILIIGCGDTGQRLARLHETAGDTLFTCSRSEARCRQLKAAGHATQCLDLDDRATAINLPAADVVYMLVPPGGHGSHDPRTAALLTLLEHSTPPRRLVYFSTTGVYGDCEGNWVDESWPRQPQSDRAWRRAAAEQQLELWALRHDVELVTLRIPGIYGPGRLPVARLQRGEPVLQEAEAPWSNRIHIDDLAAAAMLAGTRRQASGIYNVSDGRPTNMTDYFNRVADACGLPHPPQISRAEAEQQLSVNMLSFLSESRRIDNSRLRESLGMKLHYPDLEQGLAACVSQ